MAAWVATAGRLREIAFYLAVFLFVGAVTIVVLRYTAAQ